MWRLLLIGVLRTLMVDNLVRRQIFTCWKKRRVSSEDDADKAAPSPWCVCLTRRGHQRSFHLTPKSERNLPSSGSIIFTGAHDESQVSLVFLHGRAWPGGGTRTTIRCVEIGCRGDLYQLWSSSLIISHQWGGSFLEGESWNLIWKLRDEEES